MTKPIPPCPVCGTVPDTHTRVSSAVSPHCKCIWSLDTVGVELWEVLCDAYFVPALSKHGIHTLAELESRIKPKPPTMETMAQAFAAHPEYIAEDEGESEW